MNKQFVFSFLLIFLLTACSEISPPPTTIPTQSLPTSTLPPTSPPSPTKTPTPTPIPPTAEPEPDVILYRNDPQRTGAYDLPAIRNPVGVLWQTTIGRTSLGSPSYADGILYVGTQNNRLIAFDGETGEELWSFMGFGGHVSPVAIADGLLIAAGLDETVFAFDLNDQSQVWSFEAEGAIWFAPLVVGEAVYVVSERGAYALGLHTGEVIWQIQTGDHRGFVGSPALDGDTLFFEVGTKIFAVHAMTGEIKWQKETESWNYALALANGWLYLGNDDRYFYALDQQTGEEIWKFQAEGAGWSAPAIANGTVYVGNVDQHIYALDALTGQEIWQFETADWAVSDPVISDGVVYVGVGNHENREGPRPLYALDAVTGQELWQFEANTRLMTAVALGPGVVYAVTIGGTVYALSESAAKPAPAAESAPATEPAPVLEAGQWSAMVYHEALGQIVLVNGGPERGKPTDEPLELWGWDGQSWTLLDNNGPVWWNWAGVAYDSGRDVVVVHGGIQGDQHFDETWEWDGQTWTLHDGRAPGGREGAGMVFDSTRGKVVLFGGAIAGPEIVGDTWEWDGQTWESVATSGPPARFPAGTGYDPVRHQLLIYGGHDVRTSEDIPFFGDFWAWDGVDWQEIPLTAPNPGIRVATSFVFDPITEQILMFGGANLETFLTDLWGWDGTKWVLIAEDTGMPPRSGFNIVAYDAAREVYVLFGGVDRPGGEVVDETWEWDGVTWMCVDGCE